MIDARSAQALDVLIVGAGFSGLHMLLMARRAGLTAHVVEAAPSVGGTWYHNRYPGARVDIQSLEYSFGFDEALQQEWRWTERYAAQPELLRYANHLADRFGLRDGIELSTRIGSAAFDEAAQPELLRYANHLADRFGLRDGIELNTRIGSALFDEAMQCWRIRAEDGRNWSARFLVMASGGLSTPNTPAFPGLASFAGPAFHTAHWPHEAVDFSGMKVGVIGTGSSAVQVMPRIAEQAREVTVFQRTATYAVPAHNGPLDAAYESRIKADYAGFRARNRRMAAGMNSEQPPNPQSALEVGPAEREAAFEARWRIGGFGFLGTYRDILLDARANALAAEFVRGKIRQIVRDPETARLLSPKQTLGCKRLCVADGYYETYNRPNVRLVDVSEYPIDEITPGGLKANGREHAFDALVLATGFDAMTGTLMRLDLRGRGGLTIQQKWRAGPLNYLGLMVNGFPNLFNIGGPGSTSAFTNVIVAIEQHVGWIVDCIAHLDANGHATIEASAAAEAAWVAHVSAVAERSVFMSCNSWYLGANIPGKPRMFMPLLGFPPYAEKCAEVAKNGYEGFVLG